MKTHITLATALALALAAGVQAQQARDQGAAQPKLGTAVLSGTVVTDEQTPQPVRRASVSATSADGSVNRTTFTDEAGRFSLTALPEGRYTLSASKAPFLRTSYGAKRSDLPGTPITLGNGLNMTDIVLRLTRGAVLAGRIIDENGEPAYGVNVRVLQLRVQFGERTFVPVSTMGSSAETTDDRGVYRLFGLPPGEYAVTASPRATPGEVRAMTESEIRAVMQALQQQQTAQAAQQSTPVGQRPPVQSLNPAQAGANSAPPMSDVEKMTVAYSPVYYPGTTVASSASTITLAPGEERTGVDFPLRLVRTTTVEGMVVLPPGIPPQSVQLMMVPSSTTAATGLAGLEMMGMQRATVGADGKFTYTAVAPGQYTISARATKPAGGAVPPPPPPPPPPPGGGGQGMTFTRVVTAGGGEPMALNDMVMMMGDQGGGAQYWAMADVPVDGTPISGVTLALQPGMTISGKIEFRSSMTRPGGDLKRTQLNLMPAPTGGGLRISTSLPVAMVDETGHFTITGVTPGRYRLSGVSPVMQGSGPGPAWRIGSAIMKGRDVLDFMLDVAPNEDITDAVVTFTDTTQEVRGSLQDATGRPAPDYTIVVFSADKAYWTAQSRRVRTTRPGTDGKFTVTNLPPGNYRMAAVVDVAPADVNDPAFLEQLVGASFAITLAPGEQKTQDLKIRGGL